MHVATTKFLHLSPTCLLSTLRKWRSCPLIVEHSQRGGFETVFPEKEASASTNFCMSQKLPLSIVMERWWCDGILEDFPTSNFHNELGATLSAPQHKRYCAVQLLCQSARINRLPMASRRREPSLTRRRIRTSTQVSSSMRGATGTQSTTPNRNRMFLFASIDFILTRPQLQTCCHQ